MGAAGASSAEPDILRFFACGSSDMRTQRVQDATDGEGIYIRRVDASTPPMGIAEPQTKALNLL
jgi:hypothetical protein